MKHVFLILILISGLVATYSFAQMGHGMMRDKTGEMGHSQMMDDKGHMMEHSKMMDDMMGMTHEMSEIMHDMAEMMGEMSEMSRDMSREKMHKMSNIMRDMCAEMNKMPDMMDKGMATEEEMRMMHNRMMEMQKQMREIMK